MANLHESLESLFADIADAIRAQSGSDEQISADHFAAEIDALGDNALLLSIIDGSITELTAESLEGLTIIPAHMMEYCSNLASVTIPYGITSIGDNAFNCCYVLNNVTLPDSIDSIGSNAFSNCYALKSIDIPNSVTSIAQNAFPAQMETINIAQAEGKITGAPWGAINAIINYNYTGGDA